MHREDVYDVPRLCTCVVLADEWNQVIHARRLKPQKDGTMISRMSTIRLAPVFSLPLFALDGTTCTSFSFHVRIKQETGWRRRLKYIFSFPVLPLDPRLKLLLQHSHMRQHNHGLSFVSRPFRSKAGRELLIPCTKICSTSSSPVTPHTPSPGRRGHRTACSRVASRPHACDAAHGHTCSALGGSPALWLSCRLPR